MTVLLLWLMGMLTASNLAYAAFLPCVLLTFAMLLLTMLAKKCKDTNSIAAPVLAT